MADNEVEQGLEEVAQAAADVAAAATATAAPKRRYGRTLEFIMDVALQVTVEVGRARMTIQDLLQLGQGSVVEIYINGKSVARGEAVIVNEKFGVRLTDIISPEDRIEGLEGR